MMLVAKTVRSLAREKNKRLPKATLITIDKAATEFVSQLITNSTDKITIQPEDVAQLLARKEN